MKTRKMIAAFCLFAAAANPVLAQNSTVEERVEYTTDKYKVETNHFWSNWFISLGAGGQIYFGDHDKQCDLVDRIAPSLDFTVGKWFTPGIGIRFAYSGWKQRGATQKGALSHSTGEDVPDKGGHGYWLEQQKFGMGNFHADVLFNASNLLFGYNPDRIWHCSPYAGLGWARVWKSPSAKEVTANIGVLNTFRLNKVLDLNLDIRGMFVNDRFDGEGGGRFGEGNLSATVGLTYKFPQRGWNRSKIVYRYDYGDLDNMRAKLNELSAENERLKKAVEEGNVSEARTIIKKMAAANLVIFPINKSKLSNEARVNLGLLAEIIKEGDPEAVYTITGYADAGTGNAKINERLSRERAKAVYECLVTEFGVNESQLKIDYKGGVDNMFYNDPRLSRAVITRGE